MATTKTVKRAAPLDGFFHYTERGGSFKGEIAAGFTMAILAVCGMFINMQLVGQLMVTNYAESTMNQIASNGEVYAMTWFASMLAAAIGTIVMGVVAKLPLVQVTSLSLSTVLVSTVSLNTGLTYYNMLAVVFVANLVYLAIAAVPAARKFILNAVPAPVRLALPGAAGLLMAWIAAQLSGLFMANTSVIPNYGTATNLGSGSVAILTMTSISDFSYISDTYHPQMLLSAIAVVVALAVVALSARRAKHPFLRAVLVGTIVFLVTCVLFCGLNWKNFNFALSFLWGRIWMIGAEDAMQAHLSAAISNLAIGKVFTQGFDFSGYTGEGGNVVTLFATGALSYVFMFIADADSTIIGAASQRKAKAPSTDELGLPLMLNAGANVIASVLGAAPLALGKESVAGSRDGARSGLSSVVAGIVFLVSAAVWIIPTLFATITSYAISFNMYGHYGYTMQLLAQTSFSVADAVMLAVGLSMVARSFASVAEQLSGAAARVPFLATLGATLLLTNLAAGVAAGCVAHVLVMAQPARAKKGAAKVSFVERVGGPDTLVLAAMSLVLLVLVAW